PSSVESSQLFIGSHPGTREGVAVSTPPCRSQWGRPPRSRRDGPARRPFLHIWLGDGRGGFRPMTPTWTDIGYGALATGDINGDGFPDIVVASHFGGVQTLLSDGQGGFTEKILRRDDGYVAAQLADVNGDGHLDLILLGY